MQSEQLKVKIKLSGTYWDRKPEYKIALGDVVINDKITAASNEPVVVEFDVNLQEEQEHTLEIHLLNKLDSDTVQNEDKTEILRDMLLNIEDISIDGISLGMMLWTRSEYLVPKFDTEIRGCVNLGWNGCWQFKFTSPFYIWYLENT